MTTLPPDLLNHIAHRLPVHDLTSLAVSNLQLRRSAESALAASVRKIRVCGADLARALERFPNATHIELIGQVKVAHLDALRPLLVGPKQGCHIDLSQMQGLSKAHLEFFDQPGLMSRDRQREVKLHFPTQTCYLKKPADRDNLSPWHPTFADQQGMITHIDWTQLHRVTSDDWDTVFHAVDAGQLPHLRSLNVGRRSLRAFEDGNPTEQHLITSRVTRRLGQLSALQSLSLRCRGEMTDDLLAHLAPLKLFSLDLSGCNRITGAGLSQIDGQWLSDLALIDCQGMTHGHQGSIALAVVDHFPRLRKLQLGGTDLTTMTDQSPVQQALGSLRELRELDLSQCQFARHATLPLRQWPQLQSLNLSGSDLGDQGLQELANHPSLRSLNVSDCHDVTSTGLSGLASLDQLEQLDLSSVQQAGGECISGLRHHPRLAHLSLSYLPQLADRHLEDVLAHCPIKVLNLDGNPQLSGQFWSKLADRTPLERVSCVGTTMDIKDLRTLIARAPKLVSLTINHETHQRLQSAQVNLSDLHRKLHRSARPLVINTLVCGWGVI